MLRDAAILCAFICGAASAQLPSPPASSIAPPSPPAGPTVYVDASAPVPGGSPAKPFPTLSRGLAAIKATGGAIVVAAGTYQGPLTVSGFAHPVLVTAAAGAPPVLKCSQAIGGWTKYSGSFLPKARYPSTGFLSIGADVPPVTSSTQNVLLPVDAADAPFLSGRDLTNAGVTVRIVNCWYNSAVAASYDPVKQNIRLDSNPAQRSECSPNCFFTYPPTKGYGYFLENKLWMMTRPGGRAFDPAAARIYA